MSLMVALALLLAPVASAADDSYDSWQEALRSASPSALRVLAESPDAPAEIRVQAALALVDRMGAPAAADDAGDAGDAGDADAPSTAARLPAEREDLACDEEGRLVRVIPLAELATLTSLDVTVEHDVIRVHGVMDKAAGRPLHYLVEGGNAEYPSRYVVSMVGVRSGLEHAEVPVQSDVVNSVRVVERNGAVIVVVNSQQERRLRVDFEQSGDRFTISLRVPPPPLG